MVFGRLSSTSLFALMNQEAVVKTRISPLYNYVYLFFLFENAKPHQFRYYFPLHESQFKTLFP